MMARKIRTEHGLKRKEVAGQMRLVRDNNGEKQELKTWYKFNCLPMRQKKTAEWAESIRNINKGNNIFIELKYNSAISN